MSIVLFTAPTQEPVSISELTEFGRVTADEDEDLLGTLIAAARQHIESPLTGRALLTQTWDFTFDCFPDADTCNPWGAIYIPRPPLQTVTWIKYYDTAGVLQTLSSSLYVVDAASTPGKITPAYGQSWPSIRDIPNAVTVRFVAGWTTPESVPEPLRHAVKIHAQTLYEHREQFLVGGDQATVTIPEIPTVQRLVAEYRMYGLV